MQADLQHFLLRRSRAWSVPFQLQMLRVQGRKQELVAHLGHQLLQECVHLCPPWRAQFQ